MKSTPLRIIFAGTPDFAAMHLRALLDAKHHIVAVYTQPDRPSGRGKKLHPSPVKLIAADAEIPVYQPLSLRDEQAQTELADLAADLMIVVAYGQILPAAVLSAPRLGCINVHASLLPRWRGAAPIQRAIEAGDAESGVTIMQMDEGLDTGKMLATARCPITKLTNAAQLHDDLATVGIPALLAVLEQLPQHLADAEVQDDTLATYAAKILKPEAEIDWREDAELIARKVRAFNPFPICFSYCGDERMKIHAATTQSSDSEDQPGTIVQANEHGIVVACGGGQLCIETLQLPGGKVLSAAQILNAKRDQLCLGLVLGHGDSPEVAS
jgi:methionyl-tRNA formyltransferase